MKAEIICIGTELLLGQINDSNAPYLASELPRLGIDLYWITLVGDNRSRLLDALQRSWARSDITIITGGLGPTEDDVTREAVAEFLGEEITIDPELEKWLRDLFQRIGVEMPERNLKQAGIIPSARAIPNQRGTAPGWWVEREGKTILAMPGPPVEMQQMWEKEIRPGIQRMLGHEVIISRTIKTMGLSEARVDEMVSPFLSSSDPTLAIYARPDGIHLRLTAKDREQARAYQRIARTEEQIRNILGDAIWGYDADTLESLVGSILKERMWSIATMESCTGGLLASTITDVPGSSQYFKGGVVAYSAEMKIISGVDAKLLSVHGTISPEVAAAMAKAIRLRLGSSIGIGITGVAGPDEVEGEQVGTVHTAIDSEQKTKVFSALHFQNRTEIKYRAVHSALSKLQKFLLD